MATTAHFLSSK